jgi:acetokinase family protein
LGVAPGSRLGMSLARTSRIGGLSPAHRGGRVDLIERKSVPLRERLCERLRFLDIQLDPRRNDAAEPDCDIAAGESRVRVLVVRAREELIAARAARALLEG